MVKDEIKEAIRSVVKPNDVKGITAEDLANILELMVDGCEPSGGGDSNTFYLYFPSSISKDYFGLEGRKQMFDLYSELYGVEVPTEIKEAWCEIVDAWISHNKETYAKIKNEKSNGRDVNIVLCANGLLDFALAVYLQALLSPEPITTEEMLLIMEEFVQFKDYVYPAMYGVGEVGGLIEGIYVLVTPIRAELNETGDWIIAGEGGYYVLDLYCESENIRLNESDCLSNKDALDYPPVYNEITVHEKVSAIGSSGKGFVLIGKSSGSEDNFPTLDGGTALREVVKYKYLDGLDMYEVQIAKEDGYGRKVKLGTIQLV